MFRLVSIQKSAYRSSEKFINNEKRATFEVKLMYDGIPVGKTGEEAPRSIEEEDIDREDSEGENIDEEDVEDHINHSGSKLPDENIDRLRLRNRSIQDNNDKTLPVVHHTSPVNSRDINDESKAAIPQQASSRRLSVNASAEDLHAGASDARPRQESEEADNELAPATSLQRSLPAEADGRRSLDHDTENMRITDSLWQARRNPSLEADSARKKRRKHLELFAPTLAVNLARELDELRRKDEEEKSIHSVSDVSMPSSPKPGTERPSCRGICGLDTVAVEEWSEGAEDALAGNIQDAVESEADKKKQYIDLGKGEMRLLRLLPGLGEETIETELITVAIVEAHLQEYEAISYVWGQGDASKIIICNGARFLVRENLFQALQNLRPETMPRLLWIDAICIDQENIHERNRQVQQMLQIYANARRVVVWLGKRTADSDLAMEIMEDLDDIWFRRTLLRLKHEAACMQGLRMIYAALVSLYRRPWFRRTWIRQEVGAASVIQVQCGSKTVTWNCLRRSARRLRHLHSRLKEEFTSVDPLDDLPDSLSVLKYLRQGWQYGESIMGYIAERGSWYYFHGGGLLEHLVVGREFDATDERDKVYAVLGLAREPLQDLEEPSKKQHESRWPRYRASQAEQMIGPVADDVDLLAVDYSKSISEVYQGLAKYFINRDQNLDVLCLLVNCRGEGSSDLPSWTPDWRVPKADVPVDNAWPFLSKTWFASGLTRALRQNSEEIGTLKVAGYMIDAVENVLDMTAILSALIFGGESIVQCWEQDRKRLDLEPFDKNVHQWRCCTTVVGRECIVPKDAQRYDFIFVLEGARLPFLLRSTYPLSPSSPPPTHYQVVGPCAVPDMMRGEIFQLIADEVGGRASTLLGPSDLQQLILH